MLPADLDFAAACTAAEGWGTETRAEFEGFLACAPGSGLVAEQSGERVGIGVAISYGEAGFIGELIVAREHRGRGIGRRLLEHAIDRLHARGVRSIFLDGMPAAIRLYERIGFIKLCHSLRFSSEAAIRADGARGDRRTGVRRMRAADLETVLALDRRLFGADRGPFLRRRYALYPELCRVQEGPVDDAAAPRLRADRAPADEPAIRGFVMGRRGPGITAAGPWVIADERDFAIDLLAQWPIETRGARLVLGVLETHARVAGALRTLGFQEHPSPPWRMRLGEPHPLGLGPGCCAIGSAAKG
jgi:ribosomal protein S18 acetylase RimI-like enzyme